MSNININNVSGSGHTFGDRNQVNNRIAIDKVLTRADYYQMLLEIWDLGRLSVDDYLEDKYAKHILKNPHFVELLYKDVYKITDDVSRPGDGDLNFEDGDFAIKNGDLKFSGRTNNFHDVLTWLHSTVLEKMMNSHTIDNLNDPFESLTRKLENFEDFLKEDDDSPNVKKKLKELNSLLKAERASDDELQINDKDIHMDTLTAIPPKAFISYAWEEETKVWVKEFATRLRGDGIDVKIDQWEAAPGGQLPHFMEKSVLENDYVLIICTPKYKQKSDDRQGGVGYEGDIMTAEIFQSSNHHKYIPVLRAGSNFTALPAWLKGKYFVDLSSEQNFEEGYLDLITTLYKAREKAPPLGPRPSFIKAVPQLLSSQQEDEIKIKGVVVDEVTSPRNDGTQGSALYTIPFELNKQPSWDWIQLFIECWNHPPRFTTMHRPGIASVRGNKIILDGTDIEEVERYHRDTLKLSVAEANKRYVEIQDRKRQQEELQQRKEEEHKKNIADINNRLRFD